MVSRDDTMADNSAHPIADVTMPRILVVDNDPRARKDVSGWLTDAGYSCMEAADGAEAIHCLERHEVHLVTLDTTAAGCAGLQCLSEIKRRWPDIEVIVLTARDDTTTAIDAMNLGAYGYVFKPADREELAIQARQAIERRELLEENRRYTKTLEAQARQQMHAIRHAHEETILRLVSASRYRDEETGAHIKRTGLYCEVFAEALGWPEDQVENIRLAAPMHDLGKIGIPDAILQKPGKLTPEEFEVMKTHAVIGAHMLDGSESAVLNLARDIALCHHEHWDGAGYPRGLSGTAIPEAARILALVDVYDALTHRRVYHEAMAEEDALAIMEKGRGSHFDPFLFGVFLALLPELRRIAAENPDDRADDRHVVGFNTGRLIKQVQPA